MQVLLERDGSITTPAEPTDRAPAPVPDTAALELALEMLRERRGSVMRGLCLGVALSLLLWAGLLTATFALL